MILFPINEKKLRSGESTEEECKVATQFKGPIMPLVQIKPVIEIRTITEEEKKFSAYGTLRKERSDARLVGIRAKRAKDLVDNPEDVTKPTKEKKTKK